LLLAHPIWCLRGKSNNISMSFGIAIDRIIIAHGGSLGGGLGPKDGYCAGHYGYGFRGAVFSGFIVWLRVLRLGIYFTFVDYVVYWGDWQLKVDGKHDCIGYCFDVFRICVNLK